MPAVLVMPATEMPLAVPPATCVTVRLPAGVCASATVPTVTAAPAALPCWRAIALAGVNPGAVLVTCSWKVASVVVPQSSVARIVIVCVPSGAAFDSVTTPAALTEIVPV